tara:strand:+ start:262 stop:663 length:402 start_codon:yes stop_codon:yes gene_type:complete
MTSIIKKAITSQKAPAPVGPYNQAIAVGDWIFCSGQIALDPSTGEMTGEGDIEKETLQVLQNLIQVLNAAGASTDDVVRTTIYLVNLKDFSKVNAIYERTFNKGVTPARACVEVSALPKNAKVEIDCIAFSKG